MAFRSVFFCLLALMLLAHGLLAQTLATLTPADKAYGLSTFWQEANYNFVYWDRVNKARWDSTYRALIPVVQQTTTDYAYYRELQRFCALLHDGHTNVYPPPGIETMTSMFGPYRLFVENVAGKAVITRVNLSKKAEVPVGSEIIAVNGQSTAAYLAANVLPYIAASTDYVRQDLGCRDLLKGLPGDSYSVKLKRPQGDLITLTLTHQKTTEPDVYPAFEPVRPLLEVRWYDKQQLAYVALNSFSNPKIDSLFERALPALTRAKGLILDLRANGGGNTDIGLKILQYLTNDRLLYGARSKSRLHIPTYKAWGLALAPADTVAGNASWGISKKEALEYYQAAHGTLYHYFPYAPDTLRLPATRVVVPTVLLLGHNTASAAEDFLIYADRQKHMRRIGERSFGSTGQPLSFKLPGGGWARVCTKNDAYPDGRQFVGYGVVPDEEVLRTLPDYLSGRDPALARALTYLRRQTK